MPAKNVFTAVFEGPPASTLLLPEHQTPNFMVAISIEADDVEDAIKKARAIAEPLHKTKLRLVDVSHGGLPPVPSWYERDPDRNRQSVVVKSDNKK